MLTSGHRWLGVTAIITRQRMLSGKQMADERAEPLAGRHRRQPPCPNTSAAPRAALEAR